MEDSCFSGRSWVLGDWERGVPRAWKLKTEYFKQTSTVCVPISPAHQSDNRGPMSSRGLRVNQCSSHLPRRGSPQTSRRPGGPTPRITARAVQTGVRRKTCTRTKSQLTLTHKNLNSTLGYEVGITANTFLLRFLFFNSIFS